MLGNNLYCNDSVNSRLFRLSSVSKLVSLLLFFVFVLFNRYLLFLLFYLFILLLFLKGSGFSIKLMLRNLCSLWYLDLLIIIVALFFSLERFFCIVVVFQLLFIHIYFIYTTTSTNDIRKVFLNIFKPLGIVKVNYYKVSNFFTGLVDFLPEFSNNVSRVSKVLRSRGVFNIFSIYNNGFKLTVRNKRLRDKMRDFMLYDEKKRVKISKVKFEFRDVMYLLVHVVFVFVGIYCEEVKSALFVTFFL